MSFFEEHTGLAILLTIMVAVQSKSISSTTEAQRYLSEYDYLPTSANKDTSSRLMDHKSYFQSSSRLPTTGKLDKETIALMSQPRCGVPDKRDLSHVHDRPKRYVTQGSRFPGTNLTYKLLNYPSSSKINKAEVDAEIAKAFFVWSNNSGLTFTRQESGKVNIEMKFAAGEHGDIQPFDGPGGQLAHAFHPSHGGFVHFDDEEEWTVEIHADANLFEIAAHEIGHALGLEHSDVKSALMSQYYDPDNPKLTLDADDIAGIRDIYAKKASAPDSELCKNPKIDVIFSSSVGETYVFSGELCYKFIGNSIAEGYPKNITEKWKDLPSTIDDAVKLANGKTLFFKGNKFWTYTGSSKQSDSPEDMMAVFRFPGYFDAVMFRRRLNTIYFFSGRYYFTLNVSNGARKRFMLSQKDYPNKLDAAFEDDNGYAYLFKDDKYYQFYDEADSVEDIKNITISPRSISQDWFDCGDDENKLFFW